MEGGRERKTWREDEREKRSSELYTLLHITTYGHTHSNHRQGEWRILKGSRNSASATGTVLSAKQGVRSLARAS